VRAINRNRFNQDVLPGREPESLVTKGGSVRYAARDKETFFLTRVLPALVVDRMVRR